MKKIKEYIATLEESTESTLDRDTVIEELKALTTRGSGERRGQLAGLSLDQMSDEQLKRELINSKSVLYKATQRNAGEDTIARNQARVDAAEAEKAKRTPEPEAKEEIADADAEAKETVYADDVDAETANEL